MIGQPWQGDTRIVLFVRLRGELTEELVRRISANASAPTPRRATCRARGRGGGRRPAHPQRQADGVWRCADVVCGRPVHNTEAIANPEALEQFRDPPGVGVVSGSPAAAAQAPCTRPPADPTCCRSCRAAAPTASSSTSRTRLRPAASPQARPVAAAAARELAAGAPPTWRSSCASTAWDTEWFEGDMAEALVPELTGVVVPMLESRPPRSEAVGRAPRGGGAPLGGDGRGWRRWSRRWNAPAEVLRPAGDHAAYFGAEDYIVDLGGVRTRRRTPRSSMPGPAVAVACRLAGVVALDPGGGGATGRGALPGATPARAGPSATRASSAASIRPRCQWGQRWCSGPSPEEGGPRLGACSPSTRRPSAAAPAQWPSRAR